MTETRPRSSLAAACQLAGLPTVAALWDAYRPAAGIGGADDDCRVLKIAFYAGAEAGLESLMHSSMRPLDPVAAESQTAVSRIISANEQTRRVSSDGALIATRAVERREKSANRLRPSELHYGSTPKAERVGLVHALMNECRAVFADRATLALGATIRVEPDPRFAWMFSPRDVHNPAAWDDYWTAHSEHHFAITGSFDVIADVPVTAAALRANGLSTVLCAGGAISVESAKLADAGFDVTVLDLSPNGIRLSKQRFGVRPRLRFVVGDLRDPAICPGPFGAIIERRTLQLIPESERPAALAALAGRLADPGLLITHRHDGNAAPGRAVHTSRAWFAEQGWPVWQPGQAITERCVRLVTSTG